MVLKFVRPISIAWLRISLLLHLQPINLIVSEGTYSRKRERNLILKWASHLDAFSGYPFQT